MSKLKKCTIVFYIVIIFSMNTFPIKFSFVRHSRSIQSKFVEYCYINPKSMSNEGIEITSLLLSYIYHQTIPNCAEYYDKYIKEMDECLQNIYHTFFNTTIVLNFKPGLSVDEQIQYIHASTFYFGSDNYYKLFNESIVESSFDPNSSDETPFISINDSVFVKPFDVFHRLLDCKLFTDNPYLYEKFAHKLSQIHSIRYNELLVILMKFCNDSFIFYDIICNGKTYSFDGFETEPIETVDTLGRNYYFDINFFGE